MVDYNRHFLPFLDGKGIHPCIHQIYAQQANEIGGGSVRWLEMVMSRHSGKNRNIEDIQERLIGKSNARGMFVLYPRESHPYNVTYDRKLNGNLVDRCVKTVETVRSLHWSLERGKAT